MVRIHLPGLASAAAVDLDVSRNRLVVRVPSRFCLDLVLPHLVDEDLGKAKFDKALQQLEVLLPVRPPPLPQLPAPPPPAAEDPDLDLITDLDLSKHREASGGGGIDGARFAEGPAPGGADEAAGGGAGAGDGHCSPLGGVAQGGAECVVGGEGSSLTECQAEIRRRWDELHAQVDRQQQQGQAEQEGAGAGGVREGLGVDSASVSGGSGGGTASAVQGGGVDQGQGLAPKLGAKVQLKPRLSKALAADLD